MNLYKISEKILKNVNHFEIFNYDHTLRIKAYTFNKLEIRSNMSDVLLPFEL